MHNIYKYILAIRKNAFINEKNWQYQFNTEFSFWMDDFKRIGQYQYLSLKEVKEKFKNSPWITVQNNCPYLDEIVGFINWEWWEGLWEYKKDDEYNDREEMALNWLTFSNGYIARTDNNNYFDFIKKLTFPLIDTQSSNGFEQSEVFLEYVSDDYINDLQNLVIEKFKNKGIDISYDPKYHGRNKLFISKIIPEKYLENETISFWGFDIQITNKKEWKVFLND